MTDPVLRLRASAPVRICDLGGWTDTWFAQRGRVLHLAVSPRVEVRVDAFPRVRKGDSHVIAAEGTPSYAWSPTRWGASPLVDATLRAYELPERYVLKVTTRSNVPPGAGTGTSAAVTVTLLAALDRLVGRDRSSRQLAQEAHAVETNILKRQSGVQDQYAAALGGIQFLEIDPYPEVTVTRLRLSRELRRDLEKRLVLLYRAHASSATHEAVIRHLRARGPSCSELEALRQAASAAHEALMAGSLEAYGAAMIANTEAQTRLHPSLVHHDALRIIALARRYDALGWKVNGAGGEGGSLTILCRSGDEEKEPFLQALGNLDPTFSSIPVRLSAEGVVVETA